MAVIYLTLKLISHVILNFVKLASGQAMEIKVVKRDGCKETKKS